MVKMAAILAESGCDLHWSNLFYVMPL